MKPTGENRLGTVLDLCATGSQPHETLRVYAGSQSAQNRTAQGYH